MIYRILQSVAIDRSKALYLIPWLMVTLIFIISDLISSAIILTDFNGPAYSADLVITSSKSYINWSISLMLVYYTGVVWFLNIFLFYLVLSVLAGGKVIFANFPFSA